MLPLVRNVLLLSIFVHRSTGSHELRDYNISFSINISIHQISVHCTLVYVAKLCNNVLVALQFVSYSGTTLTEDALISNDAIRAYKPLEELSYDLQLNISSDDVITGIIVDLTCPQLQVGSVCC